MGEHSRRGRRFSYELIARLSNEPSLFYLDMSDGLREVALSVPLSQKAARTEPYLPKPASAYPQCLPTEDFFFSAASLEDVSEIKLCRVSEGISGVVLRYSDDREVSLGWVHPDHLSSPQRVDSLGMWLFVSEPCDGFPVVTDIKLSLPLADSQKYFAIQWRGQLEWWFSLRQCQLYHEGRCTRATQF